MLFLNLYSKENGFLLFDQFQRCVATIPVAPGVVGVSDPVLIIRVIVLLITH